jgi:hypothetical protein
MRIPSEHLATMSRAVIIATLLCIPIAPPRAAATPAVQWRELRVPRRTMHSMVWDSRRQRALMFGGYGSADSDNPFPGVWQLVTGADPYWEPVPVAGDAPPPRSGPGPRARHGAVFSPITHRMTVFGGDLVSGYDAVPRPAETWELVLDDPIHWVKRASAPSDSVPVPETGGAFVADRAGDLAWLFPSDQDIAGQVHDASVWRLDLVSSTWTRVQSGAGGPNTRSGMASTFVPRRSRTPAPRRGIAGLESPRPRSHVHTPWAGTACGWTRRGA